MAKGRPKSGHRNDQPASEPPQNLLIAFVAQETPERIHDSYPHVNNHGSRNPTRRASARSIRALVQLQPWAR